MPNCEGKTTGTRKASSDSETEAWSSSDGEKTKIEVDSQSSSTWEFAAPVISNHI